MSQEEENKNKIRIVHIKHQVPYDVYIGRPSKWSNPFTNNPKAKLAKFIVEENEDVLEKYSNWLLTQENLLLSLHELEGKILGCWCTPKEKVYLTTDDKPYKCHGQVLAELIEHYSTLKRCD